MDYWAAVDVFERSSATKVDIAETGRTILRTGYSTTKYRRDHLTVNKMRAARYSDKSLAAATVVTAESLPPTCDTADLHSLRAYLQVQQWLGNELDPTRYGFCLTNGMYMPLAISNQVAPDFLLNGIFFKSKSLCNTNSCKCHKAQLHCNKNCGICEGRICNNKEPERVNPFEDD